MAQVVGSLGEHTEDSSGQAAGNRLVGKWKVADMVLGWVHTAAGDNLGSEHRPDLGDKWEELDSLGAADS